MIYNNRIYHWLVAGHVGLEKLLFGYIKTILGLSPLALLIFQQLTKCILSTDCLPITNCLPSTDFLDGAQPFNEAIVICRYLSVAWCKQVENQIIKIFLVWRSYASIT